jgi:hypothetical protein
MVRAMTAAAIAKFREPEGVQPILVVELQWTAGIERYGDITRLFGSQLIQGRLAEISKIRSVVGTDMIGVTTTVSVTLIDGDGHLFAKLKAEQIESVVARVLLYEDTLTASDAVILYAGRVGSPVSWDEDTKHVRLDIVSGVTSDDILFTPRPQDVNTGQGVMEEDADGKPWPVILGTARDVPCPLVIRGPRTALSQDIDSGTTSFDVEDADGFGGGTIDIVVDGELMSGSFSGDTFTATNRNKRFYSLISDNRGGGSDANNPFVVWVQNGDSVQLAGKYATINDVPGAGNADKTRVNFCVAQKGNKCVFEKPWTKNGDDYWLVTGGVTINWHRYAWQTLANTDQFGDNANAWVTKAGALVTQHGNDTDKYVVSSLPLSNASKVLRVAAFRQHQTNYAGLEQRTLVPIPSDYWQVTANNTTFRTDGTPVTTIKFNPALELRSQGWETGVIYVSAEGPSANTVDQIQWVLQSGTNLLIDAASFAAVRAQLTKYRSDCAIIPGGDALQVASDMAFQARCALVVSEQGVKIRYLSEEPNNDDLILDDTMIRQDSLIEVHSDTDDVWTEVIGEWRKWYSHEASGKDSKKLRRKSNTDLFGKHEQTIDFWIYSHKAWVRKSVEFWLGRKATIWRMVRIQATLAALRLEPWDRVDVNQSATLGHSETGWVQEWIYDPDTDLIELLVWTPVESGSTSLSASAYLDDSGDSANPNPNTKIHSGGTSEFGHVTPLPFSLASEALLRESGAMAIITKFIRTTEISSGLHQADYAIDVYPRGFSYSASGSAMLRTIRSTAGSAAQEGGPGLCFRAAGGFYVAAF